MDNSGKTSESIVAGVDFGTLSVRVTLLSSERGHLGTSSAEYPLHRKRDDPDYATQAHADHLRALKTAMRAVQALTGVEGHAIKALGIDTTGSSVVPVDNQMQPLGEYYLWCDHRAKHEAREITEACHRLHIEAIQWCGGTYSHEWGFAKILHWLRHNPEKRGAFASAFEHCDMIAATLCGIRDPAKVKRSVCAMGHKWLWNPRWNGYPPQSFFSAIDPLFDGIVSKMEGEILTSDHLAGRLSGYWAGELGLQADIPIPVGAFDAHWDAIGAGCRLGDVVNVIGTSTCIIAMQPGEELVPGVCGVVPGSVHPAFTGVEAGLSAVGDVFDSIAKRAGQTVGDLADRLVDYRPGQTGLLRLCWDNGDRTVLVDAELSGITLGWNLLSTAEDELFAAMEGTALHTRIILERMNDHGVPVNRVIHAGGIPQHNPALNQIYANVLNKPILVPDGMPTSIGACIFALCAIGAFSSIEQAQERLCFPHRVFLPDKAAVDVYERLFGLYRLLYFAFGGVKDNDGSGRLGEGSPGDLRTELHAIFTVIKEIASESHQASRLLS